VDNTTDLRALLASRHPLLVVPTDDERRLLAIIQTVAADMGLPVWLWSATSGLSREGRDSQYATVRPDQAFQFISDLRAPGVFVFADIHPYLVDPLVVRTIKEAAQRAEPGQTIVLAGPGITSPVELAQVARTWRLQPPGDVEIADLLDRTLRDLRDRGIAIVVDHTARARMIEALRGLSIAEAERLIQHTASAHGSVTGADVGRLQRAKAELLAAGGIVELIEADHGTLEDVGGFERLKDWLAMRSRAAREAARGLGLEGPRGVLLTGVPGCGKSMVAKTLARSWDLPLVLLDPARLYSKYVGESEARLAVALDTVDAMAPAVLWIDEIEKGFATGDGDGGVATRILGTFLRWAQDRTSDIFVVATANDVAALPPEFLRKGRFDEVFFVDLPDEKARRDILETHLRRRGHDPATLDVARVAAETKGYSGAELEAIVVGALYRALGDDGVLRQAAIDAEVAATVPLSVSRREDIAALRSWARSRAVTA